MCKKSMFAVDPLFSANVYASGLLDRLIIEAIAPFRKKIEAQDESVRIWVIRYSRRGEHLKLRVHTSLESARVEAELCNCVGSFFERVSKGYESPRVARFDVPAIDPEDEGEGELPDRSIICTEYRRSAITLGAAATSEDEEMVAGIYTAMARGFERYLAAQANSQSVNEPLNLLMLTYLSGVRAAVGGDSDDQARYLDYHRDWLLRFFVRTKAKEAELREHFDQRSSALVSGLAPILAASQATTKEEDPWTLCLVGLGRRLDTLPADLDSDPFAEAPGHPVLFKVLHGVANGFGLHPLNEAFACHLLASAWRAHKLDGETTCKVVV